MPIHPAVPIRVINQEAFHKIDRRVTGLAFDIQNELGRFLCEALYREELARRCRGIGFDVEKQLRITVSLGDFSKDYFADLLVDRSVIVETKAAAALTPAHRGQTLDYLFLCGLHHGTLLNFRTERVQREFVSTRLSPGDRLQYQVVDTEWIILTDECIELHRHLMRLLSEWGACLNPFLYRAALMHFLGGPARVEREVPVHSGGAVIGTQSMPLLTDEIAFAVTSNTRHPESMLEHQKRLLRHTELRAIQWVNLNHRDIELRTIEKP